MNFPRYEGLDALRVIASFGVVFLHVSVAADSPHTLELFLKFRDFALPLMVMTSFFLLTISLARKPGGCFADFFSRRVKRLWLPLIVWSFVFSLTEAFVIPASFGFAPSGELPSPIVFFTGYRHLWFLQFIFLASLVVYPLIYWFKGARKSLGAKIPVLCFCLSFIYGILFYSFLKNFTDWDSFSAETDANLRLLVSQIGNYILYIPIAVGCGLMRERIGDLFARAAFRRLSLASVLIAMAIHVGTGGVPFSREIYGVAVFLAALQPWEKISFRGWRQLASYSYGIYILHFLPAQILWMFVAYRNFEPGGAAVFGITVIVYFTSLAAAALIRKLFPAEWLLPLVPISRASEPQNPADKNFSRTGAWQSRFVFLNLNSLQTQTALRGNTDKK